MSNVTRSRKSFSFVVTRIKTGTYVKLRTMYDSDYGGQPRDDYKEMNRIAPYPKKSEGNIFKITYKLAKNGNFKIAKGVDRGHCILFTHADNIEHTFILCHAPKDLDWKKGDHFNRKVEVIDKF